MAHSHLVEEPQRLTGEVPDLRVVALGLELADHDHRDHHGVFGEPEHRPGVREKNRGVEHVRALRLVLPCGLVFLAIECGRVKEGSTVLMVAFGAGFTWGSTIVRF